MAKASKAFNRINDGTPGFKPQFKKPEYNKPTTGYNNNGGYNKNYNQQRPNSNPNFKKPFNKPTNGNFKPKPKFDRNQEVVSCDKRLHSLFMSTKGHTLLFKAFNTTGFEGPVFNKVIVRNTKNEKGENVFSYYLYDANYSKKIENWDSGLEITGAVFYSDTNIEFVLKSGAAVRCEQIISKKWVEEKFLEFVLGKKPKA